MLLLKNLKTVVNVRVRPMGRGNVNLLTWTLWQSLAHWSKSYCNEFLDHVIKEIHTGWYHMEHLIVSWNLSITSVWDLCCDLIHSLYNPNCNAIYSLSLLWLPHSYNSMPHKHTCPVMLMVSGSWMFNFKCIRKADSKVG